MALAKRPPGKWEALLLVGAAGFSYDAAAAICEIAVGTIESWVNRARKRLADVLSTVPTSSVLTTRRTQAHPGVATKIFYFSLAATVIVFVSMLLMTGLHP